MSIELQPPEGIPLETWQRLATEHTHPKHGQCWAIKERDAQGEVIGTAYRAASGGKDSAKGGKRGLILEWPLPTYAGTGVSDPVWVCEGASDTAAMILLGFDAVGVPMAGQCGESLATLLAGRHAVICRDNDTAGLTGSNKIRDAIAATCASVRIIVPPGGAKDTREAVIAGAIAADFANAAEAAEVYQAVPPPIDGAPGAEFAPLAASDLIREYPDLRPVVIADLLREGETMNVVAAPKVGKSWLIHELAIAVVSGKPWLGKRTSQGAALLIDGELHRETLARRLRSVQTRLGVSDADMANLKVSPVRGNRWTIDTVAEALSISPKGTYRIIVIDALYRFLPLDGEENANETMTRVYNTIDKIAKEAGASVVIVHHASKGDQSGKSVTDVGSGAGSQSRAADTHLILRPHEEDGAVVVDAVVRSFPPMASFVIQSTSPGWELAPDLDPTLLRKPTRRGKAAKAEKQTPAPIRSWTLADFARDVVGRDRSIKEDVIARGVQAGLGKTQSASLLARALEANLVHWDQDGPSRPRRYTIDPPATLPNLGGGEVSHSKSTPGADAPGGMGGLIAPPLPPSTPLSDTDEGWGEVPV
jgi:hypothetical protein